MLREATLKDAAILSEIAMTSKSYWGYSAEFMEACRDELKVTAEKIASNKFNYWLYHSEQQIKGYFALEQLSNVEVELEALFVEPEYIGQGVGKALMLQAIKVASGIGFETMKIQGDPNAEQFYLRSGAKLTGKLESSSIPGRYLPLFEYDLRQAEK